MPQPQSTQAHQTHIGGANSHYKFVTEAVTLEPYELHCDVAAATAHYTITLPPEAECAGKFFSFYMSANGGTYDVTLKDYAGGTLYTSSANLDAAAEWGIVFCDGVRWLEVRAIA